MTQYFTEEGLEKIKKELEYLKTTKRKEIAEQLRYAISFGDLSENFAYQEAKEALIFLEHQIRGLEDKIKDASIIKETKKNNVRVGCTVTISRKEKKDEEKEKYHIVGSTETDPLKGKISVDSPLGRVLIGRKKGEVFDLDVPEGKARYQVLEIE